jgi:hypothetical protein
LQHRVEYDEQQIIEDGVSGNQKGLTGPKKEFEIPKTNPWTAKNPPCVAVSLKSEDNTGHWQVRKNKNIDERGQ